MASNVRQTVLLAVLLVALGGVLAWQFWPVTAVPGASTPARAARPAAGGPAISGAIPPPHVRLSELQRTGPEASRGRRNPFALRPEVADPIERPDQTSEGTVPAPRAATPGGPPPPPPIALKFIGTLTGAPPTGRVAVLSDGKFVYYGREGDIIEGRYRLVKIGEESLHIEYLDGRGGQTLRMSGS